MADRKITDLTALAAGSQATGDLLTIVDVSEAAATDKNKKITVESLFKGIPGNVGIGTSSPQRALVVSDAGDEGFEFFPGSSDTGNTLNHYDRGSSSFIDITTNADQHIFSRADGEKIRIDSSGRLLIGTSSSEAFNGIGGALQIEGTSNATTRMSLFRTQNDASASVLVFAKARNTSHAVLNSNDEIGKIEFYGADGNDTNQRAGMILCAVDGTPGGNDMPGRLVFFTTPDGSTTPTERMRIDSSGNVGLGIAAPTWTSGGGLHLGDNHGIGFGDGGNGRPDFQLITAGDGRLDLRCGFGSDDPDISIDSSGRLLIGTTTVGPTAGEQLTIAGSSNAGITIRSSASAGGAILFEDSAQDRGEIQYNHNGDFMRFKTAGSERMRILSGGGLTFNGDTAAANALDDYEEGTFTGRFNNQDDDATVSHNNQTGFYVKVGSLVHFSLYFDDIDVSSTGSINTAHIFGLPFTSLSTNFHYSVVNIIHNTIITSSAGGYVNTNSTTVIPVDEGSSSTSTFSTGSNKRLMIGGTYRAA